MSVVRTASARVAAAARVALARVRPRAERSRSRGTAELSVVVVAASLVAGVVFGEGLSRTAVNLGDGLTWIGDSPSGEVIQVNPATGRPEVRLGIGSAGDELDITQYAGRLMVTNRTTGEMTSFDLASILVSGQRRVAGGDATDLLVHEGEVFLVDRTRGTIAGIDPSSTDAIGRLWLSPDGIVDAAIDGEGKIWSLDRAGVVTRLRWSSTSAAFVTERTRAVDHSGTASVLIGHESGVTLFGADHGIVVQLGSDRDLVATAPGLAGRLARPRSAPADLVPVAVPAAGRVILLSAGRVLEVDMTAIGCRRPGRPEVHQDVVYVPCAGDGKVVRLTAEGVRAAADITTPEGKDPELVVDDGALVINVPGADQGLVVRGDGTLTRVVRRDPDLPRTPVTSLADQPTRPPRNIESIVDADRGVPPPPPEVAAPEVTRPDRPTRPTRPTRPDVVDNCRLNPLTCGDAPNAPGPGGPGTGTTPGGTTPTAPPVTVPPATAPPTTTPPTIVPPTTAPPVEPDPVAAPSGVTATALAGGDARVSWSHAGTAADTFTIALVDGATLATVGGASRQADVTVPQGSGHRFTVTAHRTGDPARTSAPSAPIDTSSRPGEVSGIGGDVRGSASSTTATVTISWNAAAANGSPITGYSVAVSDANGSRTLSTGGSTTTSYTATCGTPYCDPGPVRVRITAINANGSGPQSGQVTLAYSGPTAPALPPANQQVVTGHSGGNLTVEGFGSTTLNLNFPAAWRTAGITCHVGANGQGPTIPCATGSYTYEHSTGYIWEPNEGTVGHSIVFSASNGLGTVNSETYYWNTNQPRLCQGCQIP